MKHYIASANDIVWGAPMLLLILGVGLYLSLQLRFAQLTLFPRALKHFLRQFFPGRNSCGNSSFRALCAALAATVGTGNLVGVAGALCLGGPGSVFWMWVCGMLGMVTKYAEATLSVRYRKRTPDGYHGGPMYIITMGLPECVHPLAYLYAFFGLLASFGVGNVTQIHAAVAGIQEAFSLFGFHSGPLSDFLLASAFAAVIGVFLFGGARRVYSAAEHLVPFAAAGYIFLCLLLLCIKWRELPDALAQIVQGAFCPRAVTGGMIGSAFQSLRIGCSRGVFTNEAGMGTASIAHAGAEGVSPVQQGMMGIVEVFLDTIVICTLTALVILLSGVPIPYGTDVAGRLTSNAFCAIYGPAAVIWLALILTLLAVAAVIGWGFYGARCAQFLFGRKSWRYFVISQICAILAGSFLETPTVWLLAEVFNGLMAIPNLIALAALTPEVCRLTNEYKKTGDL